MNASPANQQSIESEPAHGGKFRPSSLAHTIDLGLLKYRSRQAQFVWSRMASSEIRGCLDAFRARLVNHAGELARLVAAHRNCTAAEALATEIIPLADAAKYLSKNFIRILAPKRLGRKDRPGWLTGVNSEVHRQPLGLVLVIAPGNYPLYLAAVQAIQALAAGNAVWIKPAPGASAILKNLRDLLIAAGVSPDLVQVLSESIDEARAAIRTGVDKVIFTGSASTGRQILAQLAPTLTPSVMELSGCDAVFLRSDADLDLAARAIRFGLSLNRGQTCIAPRRIFVPRQLLGLFTQKLREELQTLELMRLDANDSSRFLPRVKDALAVGAFVVSGTLHADHIDAPLVLGGAKPEMRLLQDDTFAPIACIVGVDSDEEALVADTLCPFGLSASVFGEDVKKARQFAQKVRSGSVMINDLIAPTADPRLPFGGLGQSGFGVTRGEEGLLEMTAPKVVVNNTSRRRLHYRPFVERDTELFQTLLKLSHGSSFVQKIRALFKVISIFRNTSNHFQNSRS